jgi:hypothetical protein
MAMHGMACRQFEIEIVDQIMGNLPLPKSRALQKHLDRCWSCRKLYTEWRELLKDDPGLEPPVRLYKRLKMAFLLVQLKRRLFRPSFLWGTATAALIGALILGIGTLQRKQTLNAWEQLPIAAEQIPPFVLDNAETVRYPINPQEGHLTGIHGIIWVNGPGDQVYCFIEGLEQHAGYDYQIWLIKTVKRENGGLLRLMEQYGDLLLQQRNIQEVRQISISLEPKGGSLYPTSADTILVDFY